MTNKKLSFRNPTKKGSASFRRPIAILLTLRGWGIRQVLACLHMDINLHSAIPCRSTVSAVCDWRLGSSGPGSDNAKHHLLLF